MNTQPVDRLDRIEAILEVTTNNLNGLTGKLNGLTDNGIADFRDENNFAYVQDLCRDFPWNVSTSLNSGYYLDYAVVERSRNSITT
ncbi:MULTISPECIES: hypothetical protein [unclassified Anabaena]|uniref:hypothetical protein n=1 Tax=unclassified Anabaena TaxID=2619674 RepID=UPI0014480792|nr:MULTISPECIES: hypothetical protein [unclassified Anabaena]MTJ07794.1 hypothetical protein [Anabaena sp. UHCC 0204]MTJ51699.1 hypothetical protein [Anabaena sp. UHCC 0253]